MKTHVVRGFFIGSRKEHMKSNRQIELEKELEQTLEQGHKEAALKRLQTMKASIPTSRSGQLDIAQQRMGLQKILGGAQ